MSSGQRHGSPAHFDSVIIRDRGLITATQEFNASLLQLCNRTAAIVATAKRSARQAVAIYIDATGEPATRIFPLERW